VQPVEIFHNQGTVVLRARASELLILPFHVKELQGLKKPQGFADYFKNQALVNRPARKLFEAWLRKDGTLWPRLFKTVHEEMDPVELDENSLGGTPESESAPAKEEKPAKKAKAEKEEASEKPAKKTAKKAAKKTTKKAAKKTTKKAAKKTAKKAAKKTAKKAAKKTTKKAAKKTTKKAAKKTTKKKK
jgi:hypothetical protein